MANHKKTKTIQTKSYIFDLIRVQTIHVNKNIMNQ